MFLRRILFLSLLPAVLLLESVPSLSFGQEKALNTKVPSGDGGLAIKASINGPDGLAIDQDGNLFVVESQENKIRRVDARTRIITTVAGNGKNAFSGDWGLATEASLDYPLAVVVDKNGNLYISEIAGRIRRVDAKTKIITTIVGNGKLGDGGTGDGGPAIPASFRCPSDLALDSEENLYIADDLDHRIRRVDIKTGIITTVAGGGHSLGDGGLAIHAGLAFPMGIAFDKHDNLFIADYENNRIRRVDARTKIITTVAGNGINASSGDGDPAIKASLNYPSGMAVDDDGNLFFVEGAKDRVRRVDGRTGLITTVAGNGKKGFSGDGYLASKAKLNNPSGVELDSRGNLFIAEFVNNRVRRVDVRTAIITTVAGNGLPHRIDLQL